MNTLQNRAARTFAGRKFILSISFIIVSIGYALWQNLGDSHSVVVATSGSSPQQTSPIVITSGQSYQAASAAVLQTLSQITAPGQASAHTQSTRATKKKTPAPVASPAPQKPAGMYANGSYTGTSADAYYGTVQVRAVVRNGQLADVQFLQYPNTHSYSVYVNNQAMPVLTQEALQAQSAQVNGVSGATFTSQAFQQSLASALVRAKN